MCRLSLSESSPRRFMKYSIILIFRPSAKPKFTMYIDSFKFSFYVQAISNKRESGRFKI